MLQGFCHLLERLGLWVYCYFTTTHPLSPGPLMKRLLCSEVEGPRELAWSLAFRSPNECASPKNLKAYEP